MSTPVARTIACASVALLVGASSADAATPAAVCAYWNTSLAKWKSDMVTYGNQWGTYLSPTSGATSDQKLGTVYYDGQWVFQQIAAYRNETTPWNQYAESARVAYVDNYLVPNNFLAQGYRRFPHGMYNDFASKGKTSQSQLQLLRDNPALSLLSTFTVPYLGKYQMMSREVAYGIQANIYAEKAGVPRVIDGSGPRVNQLVAWTSSHFNEWKTASYSADELARAADTHQFQPFMAGLTFHALIEWMAWEKSQGRDPNAPWPTTVWPSIQAMMRDFMKWMVTSSKTTQGVPLGIPMWNIDSKGGGYFLYSDNGAQSNPAQLLGNLLSYQYEWMASQLKTGDAAAKADAALFATIADQLFIGSVNIDGLNLEGKFFDQQYRLSFLYLAERAKNPELGVCSSVAAPMPPTGLTAR